MVDISSGDKKINITVSTSGNKASVNAIPDTTMYYSNKSREWAISDKIVNNEDYSSKYYANVSKQNADKSTATFENLTTNYNQYKIDLESTKNISVEEIETTKTNAISDITNQEILSVDNVNTAGSTQINLAKEQVTLATNQANIAKNQATIATNKTSEVVASGNTALSNIETAKTGALSNITTAKNNAISSIAAQETTSKNNVITTGNEQVERVNITGVDNRTPIFSQNEIGTNEGVYKNVYDLKHSTFDLSKFKVVGSPTITDDGVASGFSKSDYLTIPNSSNINVSNPHKVYFSYKIDSYTSGVYRRLIKFNSEDYVVNIEGLKESGYKVRLALNFSSTRIRIFTPDLKYGVNYDFYYEWDGLKYSLYYKKAIDQSYIKAGEHATSETITPNTIILYSTYEKAQDSADLTRFSITVDGKEVFSGNKTEIDTIKPDNYEVVGSPVISEDGTASGFSASNYLTINADIFANDITDFDFYIPFKISQIPTTRQHIVRGQYDGAFRFLVVADPSNYVRFNFKSIEKETVVIPPSVFAIDKEYIVKLSLHNGVLEYGYFTDNTYTKSGELEVAYIDKMNWFTIGGNRSNSYLQGSMDLNYFKIYVNGNLVYQPCLKIPYTESKTGSKIVDSVYRDRVIDLYEQEGQAGYYTIDETNQNFTLPMGEIYGMIESKADKDELNNKVDTGADNFTPEGKNIITHYSFPSDKYIDLTLGVSGTIYTAPADGWLMLYKSTTGQQYISMSVYESDTDSPFINSTVWTYSANGLSTYLPVSKGQKIKITYAAGGVTAWFRFCFARGAVV